MTVITLYNNIQKIELVHMVKIAHLCSCCITSSVRFEAVAHLINFCFFFWCEILHKKNFCDVLTYKIDTSSKINTNNASSEE